MAKKAAKTSKKTTERKTIKKAAAKKAVKKKSEEKPKKAKSEKKAKVAKKATTKAVKKEVKKAIAKKSVAKKTAKSESKKTAKKQVKKSTTTKIRKIATPKKAAAVKKAAPKKEVKSTETVEVIEMEKEQPLLTESGIHSHTTDNPVIRMESTKYQPVEEYSEGIGTENGRDLPSDYSDTKLVLMPRDPEWIFSYWEVSESIRSALGIERFKHDKKMVLRLYDITGIIDFTGMNAIETIDIEVNDHTCSWYIKTTSPDRQWCADLGLINERGEFVQITRSNHVNTPSNTVSNILDEEWMVQEEAFKKILGKTADLFTQTPGDRDQKLEFGLSSAELFKRRDDISTEEILGQHMLGKLPSSASASMLVSSQSSPFSGFKPSEETDDFFLEVGTELIVYGRTKPDANLTIHGEKVELDPDGQFRFQMYLPDGNFPFPIRAVSKNENHKRGFDITVDRECVKAD